MSDHRDSGGKPRFYIASDLPTFLEPPPLPASALREFETHAKGEAVGKHWLWRTYEERFGFGMRCP